MGKLLKLEERAPDWALDRLNRVTGLTFSRLPVSLLALCDQQSVEQRATPDVPSGREKSVGCR